MPSVPSRILPSYSEIFFHFFDLLLQVGNEKGQQQSQRYNQYQVGLISGYQLSEDGNVMFFL